MEKLEKFQILVSCLIITFGLLIASVIFASKHKYYSNNGT